MRTVPVVFTALAAAAQIFTARAGVQPLSPAAQAQLQRDKVLIATEERVQCFRTSNDPAFLTTDAVLNAFHILYADTSARLEAARAGLLASLLQRIAEHLPQAAREMKGVAAQKAGAVRRAEIMVKVPLRLLGYPAEGSSRSLEAILADQVKWIEAGAGPALPAWLGPADAQFRALDYGAFAAPPRLPACLQRCHRAMTWLRTVPLRSSSPEEFFAAQLLGRAACLSLSPTAWEFAPREPFFDSLAATGGQDEGPDLMLLVNNGRYPYSLDYSTKGYSSAEEIIAKERERRERPDLAYHLLTLPPGPLAALLEKCAPAARPGLTVAAGLGSSLAAEGLTAELPPELAKSIPPALREFAARKLRGTVQDQYWRVLEELVNAPEPDAPDFTRGDAWKRKSCQTLTASWMQMQRAPELQPKANIWIDDGIPRKEEPPPGFVEPDPAFFHRLGILTQTCITVFSEAGAFDNNSEAVIVDCLRRAAENAAALAETGRETGGFNADFALRCALRRIGDRFRLPVEPDPPGRGERTDAAWEKVQRDYRRDEADYYRELQRMLLALALRVETAPLSVRAGLLRQLSLTETTSLAERWGSFAVLCLKAEHLASRQLRKQSLEGERGTVRDLIKSLDEFHFYDISAGGVPRDDAPRLRTAGGGTVCTGIGRPRVLHVLYPWEGKEIHCTGTVLPYYEWTEATPPANDAAWRERLKASPPPHPAWVRAVFAPDEQVK